MAEQGDDVAAAEWAVWPALDSSELAELAEYWCDAPERPILSPVLSETMEQRAERIAVRAQRDVPRLLAEIRRLRDKLERCRYAASE